MGDYDKCNMSGVEIIWDEDHDERIIPTVNVLVDKLMLTFGHNFVLSAFESKGHLKLELDFLAGIYPNLKKYIENMATETAGFVHGDPWTCEAEIVEKDDFFLRVREKIDEFIEKQILMEKFDKESLKNYYSVIKNEYMNEWRKKIFTRDGYKCRTCFSNNNSKTLHLAHITPTLDFVRCHKLKTAMSLRKRIKESFREDNLLCLCEDCHKSQHNDVGLPDSTQRRIKVHDIFDRIKKERGWSFVSELDKMVGNKITKLEASS